MKGGVVPDSNLYTWDDLVVAIFVFVKIRGFGEFPIPPAIMFAILAIIAFYTANGLVLE